MQVIAVKSERAQGSGTPLFLTLYQQPPHGELTLDQFEGAALDRLRVLQTLEVQGMKAEGRAKVEAQLQELFPLKSEADLYRDTVAHYAMRLAYARPQDRPWLLKHETYIFQLRLEKLESKALHRFLADNKLRFPALSAEDFAANKEDLLAIEAAAGYADPPPTPEDYFRVRFEEALDLVRHRSALLRGGYVFVHRRQLVSVVSARFRTLLSEALAHTYTALPHMQTDERLTPLLSALTRRIVDVDYRSLTLAPGEKVRPADLDALAAKSFPPCMRNLHQALRSTHHLKHDGRLQYGLFLKGIGLALEDALDFWRSELTQKMPLKTFESSYSYNIRHNYGKEGKGTDYTPFACVKVIAQKPGADEHHGCPFRCWEESKLTAAVKAAVDKPGETQAIVNEARNGNPQVACTKYFAATHPGAPESIINHPNNYFRLSRTYYAQKDQAAKSGAPPANAAAAPPPPAAAVGSGT